MQTESETSIAQNARPLATQPLGRLMRRYAVPCMTSLVVAALYNMVDQVFIANAPDLGSVGNAATTVVFPLTVAALAIAVMLGDGCCAFVSLMLGAGKQEEAHRAVGETVTVSVLAGLVLMAAYLLFPDTLLTWRARQCRDIREGAGIFLLDCLGRAAVRLWAGNEPGHPL